MTALLALGLTNRTRVNLTLWRPLLPYGYSYKASCARPLFVIFDIRALWRSGLSVRVPRCQKLQMTAGLTPSDTGCFIAYSNSGRQRVNVLTAGDYLYWMSVVEFLTRIWACSSSSCFSWRFFSSSSAICCCSTADVWRFASLCRLAISTSLTAFDCMSASHILTMSNKVYFRLATSNSQKSQKQLYKHILIKTTKYNAKKKMTIVIIIIINDIYKAQTSPTQQMRQVSRCTITVILEQKHFQSFSEHWQWNVQQTEIGWKTVPHDWSVNG